MDFLFILVLIGKNDYQVAENIAYEIISLFSLWTRTLGT